MQVSWLLGSQGSWHCQICRRSSGHGHSSYGIIRDFSSSLWQLAFRRSPWLVVLCCLVQQALKGPPSLGSFSMGELPVLACGDREATMMTPSPVYDSAVSPCLHGFPTFLQRLFLQQSPPSHPLGPSPHSQQQSSTWDFSQSLCSSAQAQCVLGDVPVWGMKSCSTDCLCGSHSFRLSQISCFTLQ